MKLGQNKKTKICTENLSNMLFAFALLAVNNLDAKKRRNSPKLHRTELYVFLSRAVRLFPALLALIHTQSYTNYVAGKKVCQLYGGWTTI